MRVLCSPYQSPSARSRPGWSRLFTSEPYVCIKPRALCKNSRSSHRGAAEPEQSLASQRSLVRMTAFHPSVTFGGKPEGNILSRISRSPSRQLVRALCARRRGGVPAWRGRLGAFHHGLVAVALEHQGCDAPNVDLRYQSASLMNSHPKPPMTLSNAAAARVRLIVWCKACNSRVEPDPAEWPSDIAPGPAFSIGAIGSFARAAGAERSIWS